MNKRQIVYATVLFVILEILLVSIISLYYRHQKDAFLAEGYADLTRSYKSVLVTYETLSQATFNETINKPAVVSKIAQAAAEPAKRNQLRSELYSQLNHTYSTLQLYNLNQIHFHFKDLTSFLRMHRPNVYGDDLSKIRPAVVLANKRREFVSGFETGRHEAGFRFVFPLFYSNNFIGTVETSMSFNAFRSEIERRFPGEYFLLIRKQLINERMFGEEQGGVISSPFDPAFSQASFGEELHINHISPDQLVEIAQQLKVKSSGKLVDGKPWYGAASVNGGIFSVYFMPIMNVSGQSEAYLVSIMPEKTLIAIRSNMIISLVITSVFSLLLCIMIVVLYEKTVSLRSINSTFQAAIDALPYPFHVIDTHNFLIKLANSRSSFDGKRPIGLTCHAVTHGNAEPCGDENHPCPVKFAISEKRAVVFEHMHKDDAGEDMFVEVHAYPIIDNEGKVRSCIEYAVDITDRKKMQNDLVALAETDPLTGTLNRRKFFDLLDIELLRATRYSRPMSLIMLDVDNFKTVNDTHGHDVGDDLLRDLVRILQVQIRKCDFLARMGGEEFLLLIPETDKSGVLVMADKILGAVRSYRFRKVENITVSIGITCYSRGDSADDIVRRADKALYLAKQNGRDRAELL
jgi:diguanylate cyclase (GGDEF)-like protein